MLSIESRNSNGSHQPEAARQAMEAVEAAHPPEPVFKPEKRPRAQMAESP
jgi:hypothetical protein